MLAIPEIERRRTVKRTRWAERVGTTFCVAVCGGETGGSPLGEKLCVEDCGKQRYVGEAENSTVFGPSGKGERGYHNDRGVVLVLNGSLPGLFVPAVPARSQSAAVGTELAYFFLQSERVALVNLERDFKQTSRN